ncbi:hypothetical protein JYT90_00550 [bacterium AH-315-P07]|nr:hypothetical protein [bacterium AH-315-P07]
MGSSGHNPLKQLLNSANTGRTQRKQASIAPQQPETHTQFELSESTFWDPATNSFITQHAATHYLLSCNCRISSPNEIRGLCSGCSQGILARIRRRRRLVCQRHTLCVKCRRKRLRQREGLSGIWIWIAFLLWPLFDLEIIEDEEIEEEEPVAPEYPNSRQRPY